MASDVPVEVTVPVLVTMNGLVAAPRTNGPATLVLTVPPDRTDPVAVMASMLVAVVVLPSASCSVTATVSRILRHLPA